MSGPTIRLLITFVILWGICGLTAAPAQASGAGIAGTLSPAGSPANVPAGPGPAPAPDSLALMAALAPWQDLAPPISIQANAVTSGLYFNCALTTYGGLKCWGYNVYGQLGDGTEERRTSPVDVVELSSGVATVDAGNSHACAVTTTEGRVKCWGYNSQGQLGDDTLENRSMPVNVVGLASGVSAVSAGGSHSCALTTVGGVKCWGNNSAGQLGDGTTTDRTTPVQVGGLTSGVVAIAAGDNHTCALLTGGGVKCWGTNGSGQLGDGTKTNRSSPVDVLELSGVAAIVAGNLYTCALTTGGGAKCWGDNAYGKLGDDTTVDKTTPVDVMGLSSDVAAIALSTGGHHTCAVTTSGGAKCWGLNNYGQLGDASTTEHHTPVDVAGLSRGVVAASAGAYHTCALTVGGGVKCWGRNQYGQLGDGTTTSRSTHGDVLGLEGSVYNTIEKSGSSVVLAWLHMVATVEHYEVYRSATAPYCEPGGPGSVKLSPEPLAPPDTATEVTFTDTGALALPGTSYFYAVVPVSYGDEFYATSNRTGACSYGLVPGSGLRSIR